MRHTLLALLAITTTLGCATRYLVDPKDLAASPPKPIAAVDGERHTWLLSDRAAAAATPEGEVELYDERHALRGWGYGLVSVGSVGLLAMVTLAATGSELGEEAWPWASTGAAVAVGTGLLVWALFSDGPEVDAPAP